MTQKQRIMLYIAIFILGFAAISLWNYYAVTHPQKIVIDLTPGEFNLPAEEATLTAKDGVTISGWHIPSQESPKRALLLLHGYPAEKADLLVLARELYPDFSLLLIDFRYFGESGGARATLGIKEPLDVKAALTFLEKRGYEKIGVFGFSYGGTAALLTAAEDTSIDAVASYGAFADLRRLGWDAYRTLWILKYPMTEFMNLWTRLAEGVWAHTVSPASEAHKIKVPVFIGHTASDPVIPPHHAQRLITTLKESGNTPEVYLYDGNRHIGLPPDIAERLLTFFRKRL